MFDIHLASLGCYTYSQFNRNRSTIFGKKSHKQWTREVKEEEFFLWNFNHQRNEV